jgi:hypothetical protein
MNFFRNVFASQAATTQAAASSGLRPLSALELAQVGGGLPRVGGGGAVPDGMESLPRVGGGGAVSDGAESLPRIG